ncbi:transmembrane protein [Cystoisospora suis]|uniref:Transmembrane protein n=1 Tax=Cystoisospora suis TaxID=483139 RepID=A0A2C6LBY9_9APIC|nr:transmembrane protein [Cystoisospora suis]
MGSVVIPARFLDAAVMALFAMVLSALMLYMFGEFWNFSQDPRFSQWKIGFFMQKLFPFKRNFDFNLTHILLLTVCVLLLSIRPDYELYPSAQQQSCRHAHGECDQRGSCSSDGSHQHRHRDDSPQVDAADNRGATSRSKKAH